MRKFEAGKAPNFEKPFPPIHSLADLRHFDSLQMLSLSLGSGAEELTDISGPEQCKNLTVLELKGARPETLEPTPGRRSSRLCPAWRGCICRRCRMGKTGKTALAAVLLALLLCGCGGKEDPILTVCVDGNGLNQQFVGPIFAEFQIRHPDIVLEVEYLLPYKSDDMNRIEERTAALTRQRTQLMSGKGADVYLFFSSPGSGENTDGYMLFPDLERHVMAGVIHDLDFLFQDPRFQGVEYLPALTQVGRYEGKSYVLPLSYTVTALVGVEENLGVSAQTLRTPDRAAPVSALLSMEEEKRPYLAEGASVLLIPSMDMSPVSVQEAAIQLEEPARLGRERQMVIPDSLAETWFGSAQVSEKPVTVAGAAYTVCGVYRKSWFAQEPVVYLSDHPRLQTVPATVALLPGDREPAAKLVHDAPIAPGGAVRDLRPVRLLAWQIVYLGLFFSLWGLLARLFFYGGRQFAALHQTRRRGPKALLEHAGKGCVVTLFGAILLHVLLQGIRIPPEYLPRDNLFDFSHYAAQIAAFYANPRMDVYDVTVARTMPLLAVLSMSAVPFGASGTYRINFRIWR